MSIQPTTNLASVSDVASMGIASAGHLTADGMMIYLQTRLSGIDEQINTKFDKQKKIEALRKSINEINNALAKLDDGSQSKDVLKDGADIKKLEAAQKEIKSALADMEQIDPSLAQRMRGELSAEGQILDGSKGYSTLEVSASQEYVGNTIKQLESSAQLEMIELQSLMSARQTAIQLATNLISALGESHKAIVANIGR